MPKPEGFRWTRLQAEALGTCCKCGIDPHLADYAPVDFAEYLVSRLCRECRAEIDALLERLEDCDE